MTEHWICPGCRGTGICPCQDKLPDEPQWLMTLLLPLHLVIGAGMVIVMAVLGLYDEEHGGLLLYHRKD